MKNINSKTPIKLATEILCVFSWSLSFLGFFVGLYLFMPFGFLQAIFGGLFLAIPGLFLIVLLDLILIQKQKLLKICEQTKIIKQIEEKLTSIKDDLKR